jgi:hypothetical protein
MAWVLPVLPRVAQWLGWSVGQVRLFAYLLAASSAVRLPRGKWDGYGIDDAAGKFNITGEGA